jgi:hypothetical protein
MPSATGRDIVATGFEGLAAGAIMTPGAANNRRVTFGKVAARLRGVTTLLVSETNHRQRGKDNAKN